LQRIKWVFLVLVLLLSGCQSHLDEPVPGQRTPPPTHDKLVITVSILPQRYFVERVGGEHVAVYVMVPPGASPATYEPKPEQMRALANTDAYMSIGVPFEAVWLPKISSANPDMLIVDTAQGIEKIDQDPHIWLSPELVKTQAQNIYRALAKLDPAHEDEYRINLEAFLVDIEALQQELHAQLDDVPQRKFIVFHPSWGYFAREFGLEQIPIEVGGQEASPAELGQLVQRAREEDIRVIIAAPEFSTADAEAIAREINGQVLLMSPLSSDWLANMREIGEVFGRVLGAQANKESAYGQ